MGIKAGKIWGNTELVHANGVLEFHRIEFNKGFKCCFKFISFNLSCFKSNKLLIRVKLIRQIMALRMTCITI